MTENFPDPVALIQQAIKVDYDTSILSERQFDTAPNFVTWCRDPQYLNASMDLWPRQIDVFSRFFSDVCYFCSDVDYIHSVPVDDPVDEVLDRFCLLEHGVCPKCQRNRIEMLGDWQKSSRYGDFHTWDESVRIRPVPSNEFNGIWGQRCGKSLGVGTFAFTYLLHRFLALPSITRYYRMPADVVYEMAFVAPIRHQIEKYFWMPFLSAYDNSPWYQDFVQHQKDESKRTGLELYSRTKTFITFAGKRLALTPMAANSHTTRGGTRLACVIDELGWFDHSEDGKKRAGVKSGTEVYRSMTNSLRTVRGKATKRRKRGDYDVLDATMWTISSPSSVADPIEQQAAQAPKRLRMFHTRYATWEVNPDEEEDEIREECAGDDVRFNRDFGARPPRAASPFLSPGAYILDLTTPESEDRLFGYSVMEVDGLLKPEFTPLVSDRVTPMCLVIDNGEVHNSLALALVGAHPELEYGVEIKEFMEIAPYAGCRIDLSHVYNEVILPMVEHYNCIHVGYDRWESLYMVNDLRDRDVSASRYSLRPKDFQDFKEDVRNGSVRWPEPEVDPDTLLPVASQVERARYPRAHFLLQMTTVNQFGKASPVKPEGGTDDLFRCAVLGHYFVKQSWNDYEAGVSALKRREAGPVAMFFGRSRAKKIQRAKNRRMQYRY